MIYSNKVWSIYNNPYNHNCYAASKAKDRDTL